jgi:hypothetical protein
MLFGGTNMKRSLTVLVVLAALVALASVVQADVKTRERVTFKLEGFLGRMIGAFGGAKDGVVSTVAVKGDRMSRIGDTTGQIIDLAEQKVYDLDIRRKEYEVTTFEELRQRLEEAREKAEEQASERPEEEKSDLEEAGKQIQIDVDVAESGQRKNIAGHDTREVVLTITAHEQGRTVEESGGFVMTNHLWMGPKIAALDEIAAFEMKFFQAVYGEALGIDPQQTAMLAAMFPSFQTMAEQLQGESEKLEGTALLTTMTFESVKSAAEMQAASSGSGGGGFGGMLARRLRGPAQQKSTVLTTTLERLSIDASASAEDVAIPAGFKEKR